MCARTHTLPKPHTTHMYHTSSMLRLGADHSQHTRISPTVTHHTHTPPLPRHMYPTSLTHHTLTTCHIHTLCIHMHLPHTFHASWAHTEGTYHTIHTYIPPTHIYTSHKHTTHHIYTHTTHMPHLVYTCIPHVHTSHTRTYHTHMFIHIFSILPQTEPITK